MWKGGKDREREREASRAMTASNLPSFQDPVLGYLVDLGFTERYDWLNRGYDYRTGEIQCTAACVYNHQYFQHTRRIIRNVGRLYGLRYEGRRVPCAGGMTVDMDPRRDQWSQLAGLSLPGNLRRAVYESTVVGQTYFYLYVDWQYITAAVTRASPPKESIVRTGHSALFVLNLQTREFFYYDPNGGTYAMYNQTMDTSAVFDWYDDMTLVFGNRRRPQQFLPGFTYVDVAERFPAVRLQAILESVCHERSSPPDKYPDINNPRPNSGRCTTVTLLVMVVCLRFNYGMPHLFDGIVADYLAAFDGNEPRDRFRTTDFLMHVTDWQRRLSSVKSWDGMEAALGLRRAEGPVVVDNPVDGAGFIRCGHVSHIAGVAAGVCHRRPCPHSVFCAYHRFRRFRGWSDSHPEIYPRDETVLACDAAVPWDRWVAEPFRDASDRGGGDAVDVDRMDADPHYRERVEADGRKRQRRRLLA
jgi:hypothetical protein